MKKGQKVENPWWTGKHHSESSKRKISESRSGMVPWNKGLKGSQVSWCKGKKNIFSKEAIEKIRAARIGKPAWNKGLTKESDERVKRYSNSLKGKVRSEQYKANVSKGRTGIKPKLTQQQREEMSAERKNRWKDPEYKKRSIFNIHSAGNHKPNYAEKKLIGIIVKYNLPYMYTGNGSAYIDGKVPDFVNSEFEKKVIEHYGRYYHKPEDEPKRIEFFAKRGYKTLIIWNEELKNEQAVADKITKFNNKDMVTTTLAGGVPPIV